MFSILLQTPGGVLNSLICAVQFSNNFNNVSHKKVNESCSYSCSITCKVKRKDWILIIFRFNDKNPLYLHLISTLHFFEGQSDQRVTKLLIKPFAIFQTLRIVSLS